MVSLPARSDGKIWAFYSVSGEIPARSAGKIWAICVASVKFCSLASGVSEPRPPCAHSLFEPLVESPTRRPKSSQWDYFPSGICEAPTAKSQPSQWEGAGSHWERKVAKTLR